MRKNKRTYKTLEGSILPTVLIICILLLLLVFAVYLLWNSQRIVLAEINYRIAQNANIESACVLYRNDSTFMDQFTKSREFQLYEEDKFSVVQLSTSLWGLYETITIKGYHGKQESCRMLGNIRASLSDCNFYYSGNNNALIITGNTSILGTRCLPKLGIRSGQMQSEFFSGTPVDTKRIQTSEASLPPPLVQSTEHLKNLFELIGSIISEDGKTEFAGNHMIGLEQLPPNALAVAQKIIVKENSIIKGQLFATDTIIIGAGTTLEYPGGIYLAPDNPKRYLEIQSGCIINGYVIIAGDGNSDYNYPNYKQFPASQINGMVYINGVAHLQGSVKGPVFLLRAIYYSDYGYYDNTIYNAKIEENARLVFPQWLRSRYGKKEISPLTRQ